MFLDREERNFSRYLFVEKKFCGGVGCGGYILVWGVFLESIRFWGWEGFERFELGELEGIIFIYLLGIWGVFVTCEVEYYSLGLCRYGFCFFEG